MREIARIHKGAFRLTCNQNLIIANIAPKDRKKIDNLVEQYGLDGYKKHSRSEEHTSELQSLMRISYAVFCLQKKTNHHTKKHMNKHHPHALQQHTTQNNPLPSTKH